MQHFCGDHTEKVWTLVTTIAMVAAHDATPNRKLKKFDYAEKPQKAIKFINIDVN